LLLVYFSSSSENTSKFIDKLDVPASRIPLKSEDASSFLVDEDFVLITPTYGAGSKGFVPKQVIKFLNLEQNRVRCRGVIGAGNRNFFEDYCKAASIISAKLEVPVLYTFELAGTPEDVEKVTKGLKEFGRSI
jgi:protein involved in ribonucleotide reduction